MKLRSSLPLVVVVACSLALVVGMKWAGNTAGPNRTGALFFGNPWRISNTVWVAPRIALSPNGDYVAGLCPTRDGEVLRPSNGSHEALPSKKELVVWRVSDQKEVTREPVMGRWKIVWSRGALMVDDTLWRFTVPKSPEMPKLVPLKGFLQLSDNPADRRLHLDGDLCLEQFSASPALDSATVNGIAVQDKAPSSMHAFRVSTGKEIALAPRMMWRIQDLPPDAETPPPLDEKQMVLDPTPFAGAVRVVVSREVLSDDDISGRTSGSSIRHAQVSVWDLVKGRKLWQWPTRFRFYVPQLLWSPDGRKIAVIGTLSPNASLLQDSPKTKIEGLRTDELGDNCVQILDAATGRPLSSFTALRVGGFSFDNCHWSGPNFLVVDDWKWISHSNGPSGKQRLLRFFDVGDGSEAKRWDVTKQWSLESIDDPHAEMWAVWDDQRLLALATVNDGLRIFKESYFAPSSSAPAP